MLSQHGSCNRTFEFGGHRMFIWAADYAHVMETASVPPVLNPGTTNLVNIGFLMELLSLEQANSLLLPNASAWLRVGVSDSKSTTCPQRLSKLSQISLLLKYWWGSPVHYRLVRRIFGLDGPRYSVSRSWLNPDFKPITGRIRHIWLLLADISGELVYWNPKCLAPFERRMNWAASHRFPVRCVIRASCCLVGYNTWPNAWIGNLN